MIDDELGRFGVFVGIFGGARLLVAEPFFPTFAVLIHHLAQGLTLAQNGAP
jgi:hypothetical protein